MPTMTKILNTNFYYGELSDHRKCAVYVIDPTIYVMIHSEEKREPLMFHNAGKTLKVYFLT